jgi:hypothetical protein
MEDVIMRKTLLVGVPASRISLFAVTLLAVFPVVVMAQSGVSAIESWKCTFPITASVDWIPENPRPEIGQQEMVFNIDNVDLGEGFGTARMIGNAGSADFLVLTTGTDSAPINFLEVTGAGMLNTVTIFPAVGPSLSVDRWGFDSLGKRSFKATYSRHVAILGDPLPSQQYGFCVPWE